MKICDHTSVGMLVWNEGKLLLIERAKFPFGFAVPAGHVDGDATFEDSAKRELKEEVGLDATELQLIFEGRMENPCRRDGGTWHYWKLYKVEISGTVNRSLNETKKTVWLGDEDIKLLAKRTELLREGRVGDAEWQSNPGLEPVMYDLFRKIKLI